MTVEVEKWKCTEHNQEEYNCVKDGDAYYHVKRYEPFEQTKSIEEIFSNLTFMPPKGKNNKV